MILLLASAKKMDFDRAPAATATQPAHLAKANILVQLLRALDLPELGRLMAMSADLAALTAGRYQAWRPPFTPANALQAVLAYNGDAYAGLEAWTLTEADLAFAQEHLRILSGLYGLLRPLDLIQAYRLEMGARLGNPEGADLYAFWGAALTRGLAKEPGPIVNLASGEFFRVLDPAGLRARIITPVFEERAQGGWKVVSFHAKRARGRMARFALRGRILDPERLKGFDEDGYRFDPGAGGPDRWVFRRPAGSFQPLNNE